MPPQPRCGRHILMPPQPRCGRYILMPPQSHCGRQHPAPSAGCKNGWKCRAQHWKNLGKGGDIGFDTKRRATYPFDRFKVNPTISLPLSSRMIAW